MPNVKASEVKAGTLLVADGGFTCLKPGAKLEVEKDAQGLFVPCEDGHHYLDGQLGDDGHYVGLRLNTAS